MARAWNTLVVLTSVLRLVSANSISSRATDPCAVIAGQKWVAPKDVRACFTSFPVDPKIKANVSPLTLSLSCP